MITQAQIERQFERMDQLDFAPGTGAELMKAAATAFDEPALDAVVTTWLLEQREWPKPADLYRLIGEENDRRRPPRECSRCRSYGAYGGHMNGIYGRWRWCTCAAAAALARADPDAVERLNATNEKAREYVGRALREEDCK
jgi:hypothetical protein